MNGTLLKKNRPGASVGQKFALSNVKRSNTDIRMIAAQHTDQ